MDDHLYKKKKGYRTIWISDLHLGTPGCKAEILLDFLKEIKSETIYLVGDIVDGWRLKKNWYWPQSHNDVVQKLLRKARKGVKVVFIPGNHDEAARKYLGVNFGDIKIQHQAVHKTANGKKLWVVHGDQFDGVIRHAKWLAYIGDKGYAMLITLNNTFNKIRKFLNLPYWSLSQFIKLKVKKAVSFVTAFENVMVMEAKRKGYDGVVCGHIHKAELKDVNGIIYANDGDWVESLTALAENHDGSLEIIDWSKKLMALHNQLVKKPLQLAKQ
ncbi:MAG: UDP-2,3-diacylglucosamine diphosphatase [Alphaproteobacteria bacterium]|tara:strand:- start:26 stop:838 length:813 start_codon:yes stop_codon:yes gene_type:complete